MAMSGVKLNDESKKIYESMQSKKTTEHRFLTFHIQNDVEIVVDKKGPRDASFSDFVDAMRQKDGNNDDCRYGVLDYEFTLEAQGTEASHRDAIVLIMYCPESSKVKKKMLYSSSFDTVKKAFLGVKKAFNITDESDLNEEFIKEKAIEGLRL